MSELENQPDIEAFIRRLEAGETDDPLLELAHELTELGEQDRAYVEQTTSPNYLSKTRDLVTRSAQPVPRKGWFSLRWLGGLAAFAIISATIWWGLGSAESPTPVAMTYQAPTGVACSAESQPSSTSPLTANDPIYTEVAQAFDGSNSYYVLVSILDGAQPDIGFNLDNLTPIDHCGSLAGRQTTIYAAQLPADEALVPLVYSVNGDEVLVSAETFNTPFNEASAAFQTSVLLAEYANLGRNPIDMIGAKTDLAEQYPDDLAVQTIVDLLKPDITR